jgi:hypothetical protein
MDSRFKDYVEAVRKVLKGNFVHHGSVLADCTAGDGRKWQGYVEVFSSETSPIRRRVFAWKWKDGRCVAALSSPTVKSPCDAVFEALERSEGP